MNKTLFFICFFSAFALSTKAQQVLGDFEPNGVGPDYSIEGGAFPSLNVVDNPDKNTLNSTDKALSGKVQSGDWWGGIRITFVNTVSVTADVRYLHLLIKTDLPYFEPAVFTTESSGNEYWAGKQYPESSGWTDYVLDLNAIGSSNLSGKTIASFRLAVYANESTHQSKDLYVDEIILNNNPTPRGTNSGTSNADITIDPSQTYQTIEGFAASDCWMGNFVGKWSGTNKATVAKYLFSQNLDANGNPEGIGLSMWRFNLGAGTYELGSAANNVASSDPNYLSRRAECFLQDLTVDGVYDWTKCAGQRYFLQQAKDYGCESFVAFSNSPVVLYTKNGQGYSGTSTNANIQADKYTNFADYMATVVKHFTDEEYNFKYISPVNEPQWEWNKNEQEGSPWTNAEIKTMVTALNNSIATAGLTDTKILITEAGQWDYTYGQSGKKAGNQIEEFFNPSNTNYVGNLPSVAPIIAGHSYWKDKSNSDIKSVRQQVKTKAGQYNLGVFQTEWSMLEADGIDGFPSNWDYIDVAINMAKIIHSDMAYANAASWSYWTSMDMERWSQKNRFMLVRVRPNGSDYPTSYTQLETSGAVTAEPNLWALGNYSLFVRPGYQRIELTGANDMAGLMGTAYLSPDRSKIVAVYVNIGNTDSNVTISVNNPDATLVSVDKYVTAASSNLKKDNSQAISITGNQAVSIPKRSVTTLVYNYNPFTSLPKLEDAGKIQVYPNPVSVAGKLNIKLPDSSHKKSQKVFVSLYTSQGNLVYSEKRNATAQEETILLPSYLQKGIYLLKIQYENNVYLNKLIIN